MKNSKGKTNTSEREEGRETENRSELYNFIFFFHRSHVKNAHLGCEGKLRRSRRIGKGKIKFLPFLLDLWDMRPLLHCAGNNNIGVMLVINLMRTRSKQFEDVTEFPKLGKSREKDFLFAEDKREKKTKT